MAGLFSSGTSSASASNTLGDLKNDVALANGPEDSISDIAFNPNPADTKDLLAVASWDKKVRIYEIMSNGQGEGRVAYDHDGPVFSVDFFKVWRVSGSGSGSGSGLLGTFSQLLISLKGWHKSNLWRRRQTGQGGGPCNQSNHAVCAT